MSKTTTTELLDLSELGPELDESELVTVTGGARGKGTGGQCGGCH